MRFLLTVLVGLAFGALQCVRAGPSLSRGRSSSSADEGPRAAVGEPCDGADERREAEGAAVDWNRVAWDSLFDAQLALGHADGAAALRALDLLPAALGAPERMWAIIYRGLALDLLGRRGEAVDAYRAAKLIHPHGVAVRGEQAPLRRLRHLTALAAHWPTGASFESRRIISGGADVGYTVLLPAASPNQPTLLPAVIRIGHPTHTAMAKARLLELRTRTAASAAVLFVQTDVLMGRGDGLVDRCQLLSNVPKRFDALVTDLLRQYPVDPDRVYLTGFSFDGVWAWMLGLSNPDRYAGVAALSAVSYPVPISGRIENGTDLPVCVLRGDHDHMYPARRAQEEATGRALVARNPQSRFQILPNTTHSGVRDHADLCLRWLLTNRRNPWPRTVEKRMFAPEERSAYWMTVERFTESRPVDWRSTYAKVRGRISGGSLSIDTNNVASLRVDLRASPFRTPAGLNITLDGSLIAGRMPLGPDGWCVRIDVEQRRLAPCGR